VEMTYAPPVADLTTPRSRALIVGAVGVALCALAVVVDSGNLFRSWLIAYMVFLGISLGSLALTMMQHLSGGQWGVFRRIFEASSRTLPLMLVLFIPIALGYQKLYPWSHPDLVQADEVLRHRASYLNTTFFFIRAAVYLLGWNLLARVLNNLSERQDNGETAVNLTIQRVSGGGLVFYALSITAAAIDWIMSLNPHWYSTMFGFIIMGGQGIAALSFTIIAAAFLLPRPPLSGLLKPMHFHDLGKLTFAFIMLWAYFNFSQYMLTYAANLVEEIPYMVSRIRNGWQYLALFLVVFHFFVPWLLLLSRDLKRRPRQLIRIAYWMLLMRFVDVFMLVSPEFLSSGENVHFVHGEEAMTRLFVSWTDVAAPLAIGGLWLWMFFTELAKRPLFAAGDPYLLESMRSGGGH